MDKHINPNTASRRAKPAAASVEVSQPGAARAGGDARDAAAATRRRLASADATPSMAQYLEIKSANPDSLLWYRMGDFYELFFEDAVVASEALSIVLTKRGKHQGEDIAMCGVPVHRADEYLQRLIKQGYRVAVCEQLEDPAEARKRGAKAVVRRDVVRLVTPGTLTEDALLDARQKNFLTSVFCPGSEKADALTDNSRCALASVDISTGECQIGEVALGDLPGELARLSPGEILIADRALAHESLKQAVRQSGAALSDVPQAYFDSASGRRDLMARLGVSDLAAFGTFSRPELAAVGAVLTYIELTQVGQKPLLRAPTRCGETTSLTIDAATRSSLELVRAISGDTSSSLLASIDRTVTGAGARELHARLSSPLADADAIRARLDVISYVLTERPVIDDIRRALRGCPDVARSLPRLAFQRGGPRDLTAIRDALCAAATVSDRLKTLTASGDSAAPPLLAQVIAQLSRAKGPLLDVLTAALEDECPALKRDGNYVRAGFSADLDAARTLRSDSRSILSQLEARYGDETGVKSLKIRHNNILGYFIEVTQANAKPLLSEPLAATFRHRQTMANAVRFTTVELIDIEGRIAAANDEARTLEDDIFADLVARIGADDQVISSIAAALADLDVYISLAVVAREQSLVRPQVDTSITFDVRNGRHPVVQQAIAKAMSGAFIANDCTLNVSGDADEVAGGGNEMPTDARLWLVTGPNMAGKSTFLRQNALIVVLAQMGSFVPADSAHIGVVDRLFSRVGASDDLARGRSTFMVEMVETAAILNQASERSMVILDEIGRGTSTFDGLSIAWATVEFLHEKTKCRALFATHYHELTALAQTLAGAANVTMDVSEWQDDIVFLHKVKSGAADRSYGIQVAKLAGLPLAVVHRARAVLDRLEATDRQAETKAALLDDLPLFAAAQHHDRHDGDNDPIYDALADVRPDELSPREALELLYRLKALVDTSANVD